MFDFDPDNAPFPPRLSHAEFDKLLWDYAGAYTGLESIRQRLILGMCHPETGERFRQRAKSASLPGLGRLVDQCAAFAPLLEERDLGGAALGHFRALCMAFEKLGDAIKSMADNPRAPEAERGKGQAIA